MTSWRRPKWLRNAGVEEIDRILGWEIDWSVRHDYLELLTRRVEDLAHDQPPIGYRLALECLIVVAQRAGARDHEGRALVAAGAGARRMGRPGEAAKLYDRAQPLLVEERSRGRLLLSRAVLAMHDDNFELATRLATMGGRKMQTDEDRATSLVVRGNILARQAYSTGQSHQLRQALDLLAEATATAEIGGRAQLTGLVGIAAVLDSTSVRHFALVAATLSTLEASFKRRSSRGSRLCRAYIDWIHGKTAYRGGGPRAGRRMLKRAAGRFSDLGFYFDALRVSVDLIDMESTWGDWSEGVRAATAIIEDIDSAEIDSIRRVFSRLVEESADNVRQRIEACRRAINAATGRAA